MQYFHQAEKLFFNSVRMKTKHLSVKNAWSYQIAFKRKLATCGTKPKKKVSSDQQTNKTALSMYTESSTRTNAMAHTVTTKGINLVLKVEYSYPICSRCHQSQEAVLLGAQERLKSVDHPQRVYKHCCPAYP